MEREKAEESLVSEFEQQLQRAAYDCCTAYGLELMIRAGVRTQGEANDWNQAAQENLEFEARIRELQDALNHVPEVVDEDKELTEYLPLFLVPGDAKHFEDELGGRLLVDFVKLKAYGQGQRIVYREADKPAVGNAKNTVLRSIGLGVSGIPIGEVFERVKCVDLMKAVLAGGLSLVPEEKPPLSN